MKMQLGGKTRGAMQAILCLALSAHCGAASAQEMAQNALKPDETYRFVPVKNIAPELLAWRIDPEHQPEPKIVVENRQLWNQVYGPLIAATMTTKLQTQENNIFAVDVRALVPVENPRGLFVAADDDELQKLREIVALLDQPQRRVEIGIKLLRFNEKSKIGQEIFANRVALNGNSYIQFLSYANLQNLQDDVDKKLAQILYSTRVTTLNNFAALAHSDAAQNTSWKFLVVPTINSDDTITIALNFATRATEPSSSANGALATRAIQTVANMRDGDTMLLGGLIETTGLSAANTAIEAAKNAEIVFVTAHALPAQEENRER